MTTKSVLLYKIYLKGGMESQWLVELWNEFLLT